MIRILFICHGNICRSAVAEVVLKQKCREKNILQVEVSSAAATREEIGNDIYPPMKKALVAKGYACAPHAARQTVRGDYDRYDYLIGMDYENLSDMKRIYGGDPAQKLSLLRDWAGEQGMEIDDPWYTRDFRGVLSQIEAGCEGILRFLAGQRSGEPSGEPVRIAILSDTHGLLRRDVVAEIQDCTHILHAGDIVKEMDLDELRLYGSIYAVKGNNDLWQDGLRDLAGVLRFEIAGVSFLMTHDRRNVPRDLDGVQAVIFGHTHRYSEERIDGRLWLNPGSCGRPRFGGEVSMAKMNVRDGKILRVEKILFPEQPGV